MQIAGFTIIRNAVKYDYPVVESIRSVLPLVDKFYVSIGQSDDETESLIQNMNEDKIEILHSVWDEQLREGGQVLAEETNKAFQQIPADFDWVIYIQADELMHEDDHPEIRRTLKFFKDYPQIDGILFKYKHFYGSYDYIGVSPKWYRNEIRIIRNDKTIYSYRDAQGFRKGMNYKLRVRAVNASIYHYGWVRPPEKMNLKVHDFEKLWNNSQHQESFEMKDFNYGEIDALQRYTGTHPAVFQEKIKEINWHFSFDPSFNNMSLKNKFRVWFEKKWGWTIGYYKNYKIV